MLAENQPVLSRTGWFPRESKNEEFEEKELTDANEALQAAAPTKPVYGARSGLLLDPEVGLSCSPCGVCPTHLIRVERKGGRVL